MAPLRDAERDGQRHGNRHRLSVLQAGRELVQCPHALHRGFVQHLGYALGNACVLHLSPLIHFEGDKHPAGYFTALDTACAGATSGARGASTPPTRAAIPQLMNGGNWQKSAFMIDERDGRVQSSNLAGTPRAEPAERNPTPCVVQLGCRNLPPDSAAGPILLGPKIDFPGPLRLPQIWLIHGLHRRRILLVQAKA